MGWFLDRGVRTKLMMSFGVVCVLMVFVGALGLFKRRFLGDGRGRDIKDA